MVGIEDTFIVSPWPETGRRLDEYELIGHYDRWKDDIDLIASLGVKVIRYGVPWYRINPSPGRWDWKWADLPLERLLELGIAPIVDLVHYGVPAWIEGAFINTNFPDHMAEYAARLIERFRGRIYGCTPINEPRITAWYCGRLGWWPPFYRGWRGFVRVILQVCRGIVMTCRRLWSIDPDLFMIHVDAAESYFSEQRSLDNEVKWRQQLVFLALDLISGRITDKHTFFPWLLRHGASETELEWFVEQSIELDVIGVNLYPMFSNKQLTRTTRGLRGQMRYASPTLISQISRFYWKRYQRPIMITETASRHTVRRREEWLEDSVAAVRQLRRQGVPVIGYTWWPVFGLIRWAYRQGRQPIGSYIEQMGLWDLRQDADGKFQRVHTPLVDAYRNLVAGGHRAVSQLKKISLPVLDQ